MITRPCLFLTVILIILPVFASAETVKDREGAVRADAARMEDNSRWIYNDIEAGFEEAKRTGKPLMVVLRCVPCLACMGIDTEVLVENEELTPLMDQFVRVRVINANALDLRLFQFDYDLSFSVLFFNGDKTIYGRFGSWEHQRDTQNKATNTFRQALERTLALHREYPGNRDPLSGKLGPAPKYPAPIYMPGIQDKYRSELDWNGQVVKSCVHCHQIGDSIRLELRDAGKPLPEQWIFPYPNPEAIGVVFAEDPVTMVESVETESPAAKAGIRAGDELISLASQPLVSVADVSWVLHQAPASGKLDAEVRRGEEMRSVELQLPADWRHRADISRRVGTWPMRAMAFGGMKLEALAPEESRKRGLDPAKLALHALHVGQYGAHAAAKKAGFLKDDIIVEVDGSNEFLTETDLLAQNLLNRKPGDKVPVVVLRKGKKVKLTMPVQ